MQRRGYRNFRSPGAVSPAGSLDRPDKILQCALQKCRKYRRMNARATLSQQRSSVLDDSGSDDMLNRSTGQPRDRLIEMVNEMLAKNSITRPVSHDDQLSAAGLTSLDMVNLMIAVEAEFNIMIPGSDITPGNFKSISTIEALILRIIGQT
jgi:acyl carrier protein